jgi:DNA ligase (NAD+)
MTQSTEINWDEEIAFLKECADLYETDGSTPISDYEYDKRYDVAKAECPDHPFFQGVGGISSDHAYGTEVKHEYIMGSLEKSANTDDFQEWFAKTFKDTSDLEIILEPKVDGSSITNHYEGSKHTLTATRGDGEIGFDVTPNAKYVEGIQEKISSKDKVEIKGEIYKERDNFYANWFGEREDGKFKNPRNFAIGLVSVKMVNLKTQETLPPVV